MSCPMLCKPSINISCLKCELGSTSILGNGASGTTYKAFEGVFGEVAAKVLTLAHDVNKKGAKEIDLLSQVPANSFLVQLHGWCWSNPGNAQYPVILMEYMHGGSLHDILYNEPSLELPPSFKNRLIKEFADALRFLHSKSFNKHPIVHCDLKPQNLLLTMEMHLKISDLGSAFRCSTVELRLKGGEEQSLYISNRYCAPELFISNLNELPSPEVDIYSAAIILWEAMVREEPYKYVINDEFIKQAVLANNRPKLDEAFLTKKGLSAEQVIMHMQVVVYAEESILKWN